MGLRTLTLVGILLGSCIPAVPRHTEAQGVSEAPMDLRQYIKRFVGSNAVACGQHFLLGPFVTASASALQRSLDCGLKALTTHKAFWTLMEEQGTDSELFQGLVGVPEGTIYRFLYDSAPCGGPGCAGRFTIERCQKPTIATSQGNEARFGCPN